MERPTCRGRPTFTSGTMASTCRPARSLRRNASWSTRSANDRNPIQRSRSSGQSVGRRPLKAGIDQGAATTSRTAGSNRSRLSRETGWTVPRDFSLGAEDRSVPPPLKLPDDHSAPSLDTALPHLGSTVLKHLRGERTEDAVFWQPSNRSGGDIKWKSFSGDAADRPGSKKYDFRVVHADDRRQRNADFGYFPSDLHPSASILFGVIFSNDGNLTGTPPTLLEVRSLVPGRRRRRRRKARPAHGTSALQPRRGPAPRTKPSRHAPCRR